MRWQSFARRHPRRVAVPRARPMARTALSPAEGAAILDASYSERSVDASPATVRATLLDGGVCHASWSTFYRLLRAAGEVRERRAQAMHPPRKEPELLAIGPNRVWSWDITYRPALAKGQYYRLHVILDIDSPAVAGWLPALTEAAWLAAARTTELSNGDGWPETDSCNSRKLREYWVPHQHTTIKRSTSLR